MNKKDFRMEQLGIDVDRLMNESEYASEVAEKFVGAWEEATGQRNICVNGEIEGEAFDLSLSDLCLLVAALQYRLEEESDLFAASSTMLYNVMLRLRDHVPAARNDPLLGRMLRDFPFQDKIANTRIH
jgi:hypothetical protein